MLRRSSLEDDPGLSSLHRLEFYKRKKDWKLERDKSVQMESEFAAEDSLPSSCELRDSSLARSCSFASLLDTDMLSGSFLAHRSLEHLTDELTFLVEARDRPHSSQLDVSMKRSYASVAAKTNGDIQSPDGTTVSRQCMDESRSVADQMADTAVSDQNVWPVPGKNRWNKCNKKNSQEKIEQHKNIRYSKDTLHGLNQKYYGSRTWVNSSYSKIDETSVKSEEASHRDGKTNDPKDKGDDCDAPKNDVSMSSNGVPKSDDERDPIQDKEKLYQNQIAMPKNVYPMYNDHNYSKQMKNDETYAKVVKPKNDYPVQTKDDAMYNQVAMPKNDYPMRTKDDPMYNQVAMPKNDYPMQTKDDPMYNQVAMPKNDYPMQTKDDSAYAQVAMSKNYYPMQTKDDPTYAQVAMPKNDYPMQTKDDAMYNQVAMPKNDYPMRTKDDPMYNQVAMPKNDYPMQTKDDPMYNQVAMPKNDYPMQTKDDSAYAQVAMSKNYYPMQTKDDPTYAQVAMPKNDYPMQTKDDPMYNQVAMPKNDYPMRTKDDPMYNQVAMPKNDYPMQTKDDPMYNQVAMPKNDYPMQTKDDSAYAQVAMSKNYYPMQTKDDPTYAQVAMPKTYYPMQTRDDPTYTQVAMPKNDYPVYSNNYPMQTQYARVPKPKNDYPTCNHCFMQTKDNPWYDDNYPNICMQKYDDSDFIGYDCNKNIYTKHENVILSVPPGFDLNERQNVRINDTYAYPTNETNMFHQENGNFGNNYYEHPMTSDDAAQFMWNNNGTSSFNVGHRYDQPNAGVNNQMPTKDDFGNSYQNGGVNVPPGFKANDRFSTKSGLNDQMAPKQFFGNSYQNGNMNVPPGFKPIDQFSTNTGVNDQMAAKEFFGNNYQNGMFNVGPCYDQTNTVVNDQMPPIEGFGNSYQNGNMNVPPGFEHINRFSRDINKISSFADVDKLIENPNLYAQMRPNTYACPNENPNHIPTQMRKYQTHYGQCNLNDQSEQYECVNPNQSEAYVSRKIYKKTTLQYGDSEISYIDEYRTNLVAKTRLQDEAINSLQDRNLPHMYQAFANQPQLWPVERYDNGFGLGRGRARKDWINNPGYAQCQYPC